jgi:sugar/nucleoside kinase (ribokinase family)/fructose-1,6-bisphosphatase/inositol monophosphatase family enzyme
MSGARLVVSIARAIASVIRPLVSDLSEISDLGVITAHKGEGHTAHRIDLRAESVLFETLDQAAYRGTVYSEESGLIRRGSQPSIIVCDPYCNTTLTFRGFRESAIAVYEYTRAGNFVAGAIADVQIPRIVWADERPGAYSTPLNTEHGSGNEEAQDAQKAQCSGVTELREAFLTISLLKRSRREHLPVRLLREAAMVTTIDGAIVAARLAVGEIDGFLDTRVGQPSYEALAYILAAKAGGIVTDASGAPVDFARIVGALWEGEVTRHTIVAAGTRPLHAGLLSAISGTLWFKHLSGHRLLEERLPKVLCIGSVYVDISCTQFPCEEGLQVEQEAIGKNYQITAGGSAPNFARFGSSLEIETILVGNVGRDPFGKMLAKLMTDSGVAVSFMECEQSLTNIGINFIAPSGVSVLTVAGSATESLSGDWVSKSVNKYIDEVSHIYLGGTFKLPHLLPYFESLAGELVDRKASIILDHGRVPKDASIEAKRRMRSLAGSVNFYLPSRNEFLDLWETDSLDAAAEKVMASGARRQPQVIVKDGANGAVGFTPGEKINVAAYDVSIQSTVGAGDTFNAGLLRASSLGQNLRSSMDFASAASAVVISGADLNIAAVAAMQARGSRTSPRLGLAGMQPGHNESAAIRP